MYKSFNSVTKIEIIESDDKKKQKRLPKQIQTQNETMTNGNTKIAITGIIAAAITILGIVALLANANTKLKLDGEYQNDSVTIELEKTQRNEYTK